jgi:light-regulated signal transduction histidine kinase (bacteriophytochrome)
VVGLANHTLLIARDGTERPIADSAAPIRDESGNIGGVVLAFRDVADHRRWEEALRQSEVEMRRLNAELERRVAQRTAQLEAANEELEAFSYSVAHDLRAPLRAIEGFSRILLDKYLDRLDVLGKDYLERVGAAAKRLEQLIGDLLNLSRLTRSEMRQVTVDLSALAEAVATELQQREPQRRVEFVIAPEVVACGDARLLRFALDNLLGNAWKYTGTREEARIEFGAAPINGQTAYFVRDNGAGFDMAYVEKLFRPFQRLHTEREFPGTGIGLASVKRVVGRHGGRVWAEGAVERGATFYFTLVTRPDSHPASGGTTHGGQIHALGGG